MTTLDLDISTINFDKLQGLIPACIQDNDSMQVLMLGFMNLEALEQTLKTQQVTFYSRTKKRLWVKGETSGNFLNVVNISLDCDRDSLLIFVTPAGPSCHTGTISCFSNEPTSPWYNLASLYHLINNAASRDERSYTRQLLASGIPRIAQKVGEEAVEVAISALAGSDEETAGEVVDLLYHLLVLLTAKQISMQAVAKIMNDRRKK